MPANNAIAVLVMHVTLYAMEKSGVAKNTNTPRLHACVYHMGDSVLCMPPSIFPYRVCMHPRCYTHTVYVRTPNSLSSTVNVAAAEGMSTPRSLSGGC